MAAPRTAGSDDRLFVVAVSKQDSFLRAVESALTEVTRGSGRRLRVNGRPPAAAPGGGPAVFSHVVHRARRYLDHALPYAEVRVITAGSLRRAGERFAAETERRRRGRQALALVVVDAEGTDVSAAALDRGVDDALGRMLACLPGSVEAEISPYTTMVYQQRGDNGVQTARRYTPRYGPAEPWIVAADTVCAFTDYVQVRHSGLAARLAAPTAERTLARALRDFLHQRAGSTWGLHYYTGSVVSGLIADLERLARADGNPVLRGPSEHSLACGALARWQLDRAPFLIVVTSGMLDEFRGVLANLRHARAQGFIICGDAGAERWFPFQGTVHANEDSREVLRARRIPAVYLDRPERLADDLRSAAAMFTAGEGPVVLLGTPKVLDATVPPPRWEPQPAAGRQPVRSPDAGPAQVLGNALDTVTHLLNRDDATLLWQCADLTGAETDLVHDVAHRAGIALVDSLDRPGSVAKYRDGRVVEEYLGTLGLYGYSARVHDYLHRDGRLKPRDEQCLFFLNSRIAEIATPFSERVLSHALRIVQVTDNPSYRAPFADHPIIAELAPLLRAVRDRLDVDPGVLRRRRVAIRSTRDSAADVVGELPLQPMSVNYFFRRLAAVLDRLITTRGYTYTGVFDVGRGGLSAVRNLPRTGPGFSGWYGRAIMGDALQAVPALAVTRPGNLLVFVGDGAAALGPDIMPTLIQQVCTGDARVTGNVSIFRLIDGGHSLIRTYREARQGTTAGYQAELLTLVDEDWHRAYGPIEVRHRRLADVDTVALSHELQDAATVNLYSVLLAHNNEGDGLSLLASLGWQRDQLSELALATAGRPAVPVGGSR
jgi:thiamine pyrophosphate-dependent acetolactate synthase large subunit-like protein